ncbi:helix-hairpin-helix domain-containing protein [Anaerovorax odorimutans]|uniref:helix-hairpin-helix domain-containing protein n=1 Tax=Anaerovorax odorimutans TaxID=109327 RepID=UPI0003FE0AE5|nr:helix-hairpin-helix domain-containing protein [Anaerovorax odorimutans]
MKKLFELLNNIPNLQFRLNKKFALKVTAGVVLFVVAFTVYLGKIKIKDDTISISEPIQNENLELENKQPVETTSKSGVIYVDITGAVVKPSVIKLPEESRVFEAVELAGGITSEGETKYINLAEKLSDGEKIYIPTKKEIKEKEEAETEQQDLIKINGEFENNGINKKSDDNKQLININTADSTVLQQLTGIGPSTAEKIISYRESNGLFKKIEDLKNVNGIGDKIFEKLKNNICIN